MPNRSEQPDQIRQMMIAIWQRNLPLMRERLDQLDRAADSVASGTLTPEERKEAAGTAHKLAGSLGMYGYTEGTDIARRLEHDLLGSDAMQAQPMRELMAALRTTLDLAADPPAARAPAEPELQEAVSATSATHSRASE